MKISVGQAIVRFLDCQYLCSDGQEHRLVGGIAAIFGHGCVVGLGEALAAERYHFPFYQGHNEQGMAFMAMAYAKQHRRRKILPVVSSIGPGAMNMVTAAAVATINRIPLLLFPGDSFSDRQPDPVLQQVELPYNGDLTANDAFRPVTRYWDRIHRPEQLMPALLRAMRVLTDPAETGAVCLCLPQDVQAADFDFPDEFFERRIHYLDRPDPPAESLLRAVERMKASRRPFLIAGGGVRYSGAGRELADFAEEFEIPFGETQAGKGTLRWDHPMNLGGIGVTGSRAANELAGEADLIIAVGSRLSDFTTGSKSLFGAGVPFVSVNLNSFDGAKMNALALRGDVKRALILLRRQLKALGYRASHGNRISEVRQAWNEEIERLFSAPDVGGLLAQTRVLGLLNGEAGREDDLIVAAAGSPPADLQRIWRCRREDGYHVEFGASAMGYEVAGALGAKLAAPDREVFCLLGDGSFTLMHSELMSSLQEGSQGKINLILLDNRGYGCIDNLQRSQGIPAFGCEFRRRTESGRLDGVPLEVDYAAIGWGYGCAAWTVRSAEEFVKAVAEARACDRSTLIDVKVDENSMTEDTGCWWRVGVPEVSAEARVREAGSAMSAALKKARWL